MQRSISDIFQELLGNRILFCCFFSWLSAQVIKYVIDGLRHRGWKLSSLFSSGGMPSSHTSSVVSLTLSVGFTEGFGSAVFTACFVFALIVMYDAAGVRFETGRQGSLLNSLLDELKNWIENPLMENTEMKERVGHSPLEILAGAVLGALFSILFFVL